jgi:signal transduction histidine kinase
VADPGLAQRLGEHIAVLQRAIDAIVKEARRPVRSDLSPGCDAVATVRDRVDFWRPLADDQERPLTVRLYEGSLRVPLAAEDLADLVDVLVDNVFAHTPEGTALRLDLGMLADGSRAEGSLAVLRVADAGPGLGKARRRRAGSTGLGLDIARRTATAAGGTLDLRTAPEGGTLAEVSLPVLGRPPHGGS